MCERRIYVNRLFGHLCRSDILYTFYRQPGGALQADKSPKEDLTSAPVAKHASAPTLDPADPSSPEHVRGPAAEQASAPAVEQASAPAAEHASARAVEHNSAAALHQRSHSCPSSPNIYQR